MKGTFFALLSALVSTTAMAQTNPEVSCYSSFGARGPIRGYQLTITKSTDTQTWDGMLYLDCPACMVQPSYLTFERKFAKGTLLTYLGPIPRVGPADRLTISLESFLPTRTFPARLSTPKLNNAEPVDFTCQLQ